MLGKPFPVVQTQFNDVNGRFSPDGKWIAYQSEESGRYEIYVIPFSRRGTAGKRQISSGGGVLPRWRRDGRELSYIGPDNRFMAAELSTRDDSVEVGQVHVLFSVANLGANSSYDVSIDGQHFLHSVPPKQKFSEPLTLIENWPAALKN